MIYKILKYSAFFKLISTITVAAKLLSRKSVREKEWGSQFNYINLSVFFLEIEREFKQIGESVSVFQPIGKYIVSLYVCLFL